MVMKSAWMLINSKEKVGIVFESAQLAETVASVCSSLRLSDSLELTKVWIVKGMHLYGTDFVLYGGNFYPFKFNGPFGLVDFGEFVAQLPPPPFAVEHSMPDLVSP